MPKLRTPHLASYRQHLLSWVAVVGLVIAAGVLAGLTLAAAGPADAHWINASHWSSSPVGYNDLTDNYSGNIVSLRIDFNSAVSELSTADEGSSGEVEIADDSYGDTWVGLCTSNWVKWDYIDLNDTKMSTYGGNKESAVIAHEMGHCMGGAAHHYTNAPATGRIMQKYVSWFYDDDDVWGMESASAAEIDDLWD